MKNRSIVLPLVLLVFVLSQCQTPDNKNTNTTTGPVLPAPYATKITANSSHVVPWPEGKMPTVPAGFKVSKYLTGLNNPRWIYILPNGDILLSLPGARRADQKPVNSTKPGTIPNSIMLCRGMDANGHPKETYTFLAGLDQPFGMLLLNDYFYVGNTNSLWRYPYTTGLTSITSKGEKILYLPGDGYNNHWTRNLIANAEGTKIYITVGSSSNVGENGMISEEHRANILEINTDGTGLRVYASGLRNPVGMDWAPGTHTLWTAVNERDNLGDDLVPDYITSVKDGGFYGWPYSYFGQHLDPRIPDSIQRPDLVKRAIVPDVAMGAHTASLSVAFYTKTAFPAEYRGGVFVGQHGSWNRSVLAGYRVAYVPFKDGKPAGGPQDFMTGFIADRATSAVYGRPVCVRIMADGSLLVSDDAGGTIWHITAQ